MQCEFCGCQSTDKRRCPQCGNLLVYNVSGTRPPAALTRPSAGTTTPAAADHGIDWRALAIGGVLGSLLAAWGGFLFSIIGMLSVLIHETGHALAAWLVGRPAIPKFDLQYGGGITPISCRNDLICALLAIAALWLLWHAWQRGPRWVAVTVIAVAIPPILIVSGWDALWFTAAGHAAEAIMAAVFLVRAATGIGIAHRLEAGLSALIGTGLWWQVSGFASSLIHDASFQDRYADGKGGVLNNDLTVLADLAGGTVVGWAWALLIFSIIALFAAAAVTWGIVRYRHQQASAAS